jgi:hypothetical protein
METQSERNCIWKFAEVLLDGSCLYGCFSRTQYVVFAAKLADARSKLGRDRSHVAGACAPIQPRTLVRTGTFRSTAVRQACKAPTVGTHPPLLTTTSGGLLKQPYKQETARLRERVISEPVLCLAGSSRPHNSSTETRWLNPTLRCHVVTYSRPRLEQPSAAFWILTRRKRSGNDLI